MNLCVVSQTRTPVMQVFWRCTPISKPFITPHCTERDSRKGKSINVQRQAITRTNADPVHLGICAVLGGGMS